MTSKAETQNELPRRSFSARYLWVSITWLLMFFFLEKKAFPCSDLLGMNAAETASLFGAFGTGGSLILAFTLGGVQPVEKGDNLVDRVGSILGGKAFGTFAPTTARVLLGSFFLLFLTWFAAVNGYERGAERANGGNCGNAISSAPLFSDPE